MRHFTISGRVQCGEKTRVAVVMASPSRLLWLPSTGRKVTCGATSICRTRVRSPAPPGIVTGVGATLLRRRWMEIGGPLPNDGVDALPGTVTTFQPSWCRNRCCRSSEALCEVARSGFLSPRNLNTICDELERRRPSFPAPNLELGKPQFRIYMFACSALSTKMAAPARKSGN